MNASSTPGSGRPHCCRRDPLHFAHSEGDELGEDLMTVAYLRETAEQAGTRHGGALRGRDRLGPAVRPLRRRAAPLHPQLLQALPVGVAGHRPLRPACPGHPRQRRRHGHHLLDRARLEDAPLQQGAAGDPLGALSRTTRTCCPPTSTARANWPTGRRGYVAKPLLGREGAGVTIHEPGGAPSVPYGTSRAATRSWPRCPTSTATGSCSAPGSSRTSRRGSASGNRRAGHGRVRPLPAPRHPLATPVAADPATGAGVSRAAPSRS